MFEGDEHSKTWGALADTRRTNIGFVLSHEQFPVTELVDFAPRAEELGFDALSTSDHFQPWQANEGHVGFAWVTLAAVGQRTRRIPFGTAVTCPTYRYQPAIVAEAFASLGLLHPGRVYLGVGTGEALNEVTAGGGWGHYQERAQRLVEAVHVIRQLWSGEIVDHHGDFYEVKKARLYDVPSTPVPIYIAASGPKSAQLAGQYGDGLITDSASAVKPAIRQAFEAGARAAGKDPASMPVIAEQWVCVGDEAEAEQGGDLWRFLPRAWTEFVHNSDPIDIMRRARAEVPMQEALATFTVSPEAGEHIEALQKLVDGGVTTIVVHSAQTDQFSVMEFYSQHVLPKVRRERVTPNSRS